MSKVLNWIGNQAKNWLAREGRDLIVREADKFLSKQLGVPSTRNAQTAQNPVTSVTRPVQPDVNLEGGGQSSGLSLARPLGLIDPELTRPRGMRFNTPGFNQQRELRYRSDASTFRRSTPPENVMNQSPAFAANFGQRALTRANMQTFLNSAAALAEHYSRIADIESNRRQEALRRYIQSVTEALNNLNAAVNDYATLT
jgi:hypothetical protein